MTTNEADQVSGPTAAQVRIRIQGLRRSTANTRGRYIDDSPITSDETILLPGELPVSALWDKLQDLGYDAPKSLSRNEKVWSRSSFQPRFKEFEQITVVQDHLSDPSKSIHVDDRLISYTNRRFGTPIQLNIDENSSNTHAVKLDCLKDSHGLEIMFHRTVRMPDDEKIHQLPGSLGAFPLYSVDAYSDKLPNSIVQAGGVFMPMWQREALWMSLGASTYNTQYALRFSVGRINAVSGLQMNETNEVSGDMESAQDYVVVPGQQWLDGICIAPGIVRQFVAMPLGSGYTVEGQKTGEEKHGGLQIEVIPSFEKDLRTWIKDQNGCSNATELLDRLQNHRVDEFKTPRELGFGVGDTVRLYPYHAYEYSTSTLMDMVQGGQLEDDGTPFTSTYHIRPSRSPLGGGTARGDQLHPFDSRFHDAMADCYGDFGGAAFDSFQVGSYCTPNATYGLENVRPTQETFQAESQATIKTQDLKAMGLAAGGKLVQDIYRDLNPARIWNTEAARIVHVHILDPASCEAVTHIVPPPPPIDAMGYAEEGGSFFVVEEQPENRVDGGDFDNVKSVAGMDKANGVASEPSLDPSQPTRCKCGIRLCDCVVRPCAHQFCNVCIREMDPSSITGTFTSVEPQSRGKWLCPTCKAAVSYVAGFSAPMNLPGEESVKARVPVNVLEVEDGRAAFKSIQRTRL